MSHKERLLDYLFNRPGRTLMNIRFAPGTKAGLTEEELCEEAHDILYDIDNGRVAGTSSSGEPQKKPIDVMTLG